MDAHTPKLRRKIEKTTIDATLGTLKGREAENRTSEEVRLCGERIFSLETTTGYHREFIKKKEKRV